MKIKHIAIFILLISVNLNSAFSQTIKSFTAEDQTFLKELKTFLEKGDKKEGKTLYTEFENFWLTFGFAENEKQDIFNLSNLLLKNRATAFPYFEHFLKTIMVIKRSNQDVESYNEWKTALIAMLTYKDFNLTKIDLFLVTCYQLINSQILYQSAGNQWIIISSDFHFKFNGSLPIIEFEKSDLTCYSKDDSLTIYNTHGIYFPTEKKWTGKDGTVFWDRAKISRDTVFAILKKYEISMIRSYYSADSVKFTNRNFSNEPFSGTLEDKIISMVNEDRVSYPRFESYEKRITVKNLYPGIDYDGSFSMHGAKIISTSSKNEDAFLIFYSKDKKILKAASKNFIFKRENITGINTSISIYIENDSMYHPGLLLRYNKLKNELQLIRTGEGVSRSPWFNSYHNVDMYFEVLTWKTTDPKMDFGILKGGAASRAVFESVDYYSENRYDNIQGMDKEHPFVSVYNFSVKKKSDEFKVKEYCDYLGFPLNQVRQQLYSLSYMGVISYDDDNEIVKIKKRLYTYLKASSGKIDYDVIEFESSPDSLINASLSLITNDMRIWGVPNILLSDSQNVKITPLNGNILLHKNRNFAFDGKVSAGLFDYYGKQFEFNYNNFKIDLNNIDSLRIWVKSGKYDEMSREYLVKVKTVITDVTGDLIIDDAFNKSSRKHFPEYPVFNSRRNSYVYYDKFAIQKGVYKRDKFYFRIYPFTIDSLNTFSTQGLEFAGTFASADIFPEFDEKIKVQKDLSLGFVRSTPPSGFSCYLGKGNYQNIISLSHEGLRGDGTLKYLTSTTKSDDFIFYPDSTNSLATTFSIDKQVATTQYPSVTSENVYVHWLPYADSMLIRTNKNPFQMYDKQLSMNGTLVLQPSGLTGKGKNDFENAEMNSELFDYKANKFTSDKTDFKLKTDALEDFTFVASDLTADVDFTQRKGKFELNDKEGIVAFPANEYICSMDVFNWYMDKYEIDLSVSGLSNKELEVKNPAELAGYEGEGAKFTSVQPRQDSLNFNSPIANYKIKEHLITAYKVKSIIVGDATILPGNQIVVIEKKAIMQTLQNAKIVANNTTTYHTFYNVVVDIFGKKHYSAYGDYDYIDLAKNKQVIHFDKISLNDSTETYAQGNLPDSMHFSLSPHFLFQGKVKANAAHEFLNFKGSTKMTYNCNLLTNNWLYFDAEIDPQDVRIPVSKKPYDINRNDLTAGFVITRDSAHIYSTFLTKAKKPNDDILLTSDGFLIYDTQSKEYQIADTARLNNPDLTAPFLSLNSSNCRLYGEGKIELGVYTGQVKMNTAGNITHDLAKDSVEMNVMMTFDFFFPKNLLQIIINDLTQSTGLSAADLSSETFIKGMNFMLGEEKGNQAIKELSMYGKYQKFPDELEKTLVFTNVYLRWNQKTKSYVSQGELSIGNMLKNEVNRSVDGKIELTNKRTGNEFTIYLSIGYEKWYYLNYSRNTIAVLSSDDTFNQALRDIKPDDRKKEIKNEPPLTIVPATERKKRDFLRKFNIEDEMPEDEEKE